MRLCLLAGLAIVGAAADTPIIYDGSSTVYPIIVAAAESYADVEPRFSLEAKPTGSTAGFRSMLAKTCTINGASRAINAKELKAATEAKVDFIEVPIAFDALSVVTNPRNPWLKDLKVAELQALYAGGGATSWKQVRAGFPEAKVSLFGAGSDSGTYDYFQEAIIGKERKFRPDITVSEDDHVLVQGVAADVNAIGYMGLAYVIENAQTLRAVAIDSGKGPVMPTKQSVLDGSYVPLSRPIFVYLSSDSLSRPDVVGFLNYLLDKPEVIESVGYVALPAAMRTEIKERFAKRTTGSVFSGVAVGTTLAQAMGVESEAAAPKPVATKPAAAPAIAAVVAPVAAIQVKSAWSGPSGVKYQQDLERLRAASLDLARRSLEDGATVEEIAKRTAELKAQAEALAETFRSAPRQGGNGLSLAEAAALAK
jgi:phosphate transport system substrate-binding protein